MLLSYQQTFYFYLHDLQQDVTMQLYLGKIFCFHLEATILKVVMISEVYPHYLHLLHYIILQSGSMQESEHQLKLILEVQIIYFSKL